MRHELNPISGEHVEEGRLLVIAVSVGRVIGKPNPALQAAALDCARVNSLRLMTCGSGIRRPRRSPWRFFVRSGLSLIGIGGFEFHVTCEWRSRRAHQGIQNVVADSGEGPGANEIAFARLFPIAAYGLVIGIVLGQSHLGPDLESGPAHAVRVR